MANKSRRPIAMSTPPPAAKHRSAYSADEKQSLLDNFDLEVADKTRIFRDSLSATLQAFLVRQNAEIARIPLQLRKLTLGELETKWGGSWSGTIQRLTQEKLAEAEREREREEVEVREKAEGAKGKRKRGTAVSVESSPVRPGKNARRDHAPSASKQPLAPSSAANKRKPLAALSKSTRQRHVPASPISGKPPSSLPQNHVFNPRLPPTPSMPRQARQNEPLLSANGSPLFNTLAESSPSKNPSPSKGRKPPAPAAKDKADEEEEEAASSSSESDYDLPDPAILEAKLLAKHEQEQQSKRTTPSSKGSKPSSRKVKRAPSLMFRQSLSVSHPQPVRDGHKEGESGEVQLAHIPLSDGRTISFNPLQLTPGRIDTEIDEGGLGEDEKGRVKERLKEEVMRALMGRMEKWRVK